MEELKQLSLEVYDSYSDFVHAMEHYGKTYPDRLNDIINYMKENKEMGTSDILGWVFTEIDGIDLDNPPKLEIIDDDEE